MVSRRQFHQIAIAAAASAALPASAQTPPAPLVAAAAAAGERPRQEARGTIRSEIIGSHGIVAAGRNFTVQAGTRILAAGGNAFDAGVAAVFAAAVNEISHFGLGGEAPVVLYQAATGKVTVVSGQGTAPKAASPKVFQAAGVIPGNGPNGGTIP